MLINAFIQNVAAALQASALILSDVNVAEVGLQLVLVDGWTHLDRFIQTIANLQPLCAIDVALHELCVDAFLHNDPAGRGAALACRSEATPQPAFNRKIEIGVIENDHGILAAKFERTTLKALGRGRTHDASHCARTSQRNGAHVGVFGEWRANLGAESRNDVNYALRQASIIEHANKIESRQRSILRWLDDTSISAHQRRQKLPRRNCHREIPWC